MIFFSFSRILAWCGMARPDIYAMAIRSHAPAPPAMLDVGVNAILPPHVAGCHVAGCCTYAFFHQASTASIDFAMRAPMRASTPVLPL